MPLIRLQKVIAEAGLASRRKAEEMMVAGRVTVNGRVITRLGTRVDPERDQVAVDGRILGEEPKVIIVLNKPRGYVSTASDERGRPAVVDLVSVLGRRVYPVGRLDQDTEGLLLLTNDGRLSHALTHPSVGVPKTYVALIRGHPGRSALRTLTRGVDLEDGRTAPAKVRLIGAHGGNAILEITLHEGKKREVRRMCEAVGHEVLELKRTRFGPLVLGSLAPGRWRRLSEEEVQTLYRACGLHPAGRGEEAGGRTAKQGPVMKRSSLPVRDRAKGGRPGGGVPRLRTGAAKVERRR